MAILNINLTDYKDRFGQNVPPGRYLVTVDDLESTHSKVGNPMVNLWFRVTEGPQQGQVLLDRLTITEKALFKVVGFMQAIGLPTPRKNLQVNLNTWLGRSLLIDVEDGAPYNGRVKSEVRGYLRPDTASTPEPQEDLADLDPGLEIVTPESDGTPPEDPFDTSAATEPETVSGKIDELSGVKPDEPKTLSLDEISL